MNHEFAGDWNLNAATPPPAELITDTLLYWSRRIAEMPVSCASPWVGRLKMDMVYTIAYILIVIAPAVRDLME